MSKKGSKESPDKKKKGIPKDCPLFFWETPTPRRCSECYRKCPFNK